MLDVQRHVLPLRVASVLGGNVLAAVLCCAGWCSVAMACRSPKNTPSSGVQVHVRRQHPQAGGREFSSTRSHVFDLPSDRITCTRRGVVGVFCSRVLLVRWHVGQVGVFPQGVSSGTDVPPCHDVFPMVGADLPPPTTVRWFRAYTPC